MFGLRRVLAVIILHRNRYFTTEDTEGTEKEMFVRR